MEKEKLKNEDENILEQFMELMREQNMAGRSQEFMAVLGTIGAMQVQLGTLIDELREVKEQLAQFQGTDAAREASEAPVGEAKKVSDIYEKTVKLSNRLAAGRRELVGMAKNAMKTFRDKGRQGLDKAMQKGRLAAAKLLAGCREQMSDILADCKSVENRMDRVGNEIKQIGNSTANIGRLLSGKEARPVSGDKEGVAFTRAINAPVKKVGSLMEKNIKSIDGMLEKLGYMEKSVSAESEKAGKRNTSLLGKLHQKQDQKQKETSKENKEKERDTPDNGAR